MISAMLFTPNQIVAGLKHYHASKPVIEVAEPVSYAEYRDRMREIILLARPEWRGRLWVRTQPYVTVTVRGLGSVDFHGLPEQLTGLSKAGAEQLAEQLVPELEEMIAASP
jgi:hypothetical protein